MSENTCQCGSDHQGHVCVLTSKGLTEQLAAITDAPTVVCFTCGAEANANCNVCNPMPLTK